MRGDTGCVDFEHILLEDEVLSPQGFYVVFYCASHWSEVVESCASSVDLKTLEKDVPPFDEIFQQLSVFDETLG